MIINAPISIGELFDKITILQIKAERITDSAKLQNITTELFHLYEALNELTIPDVDDKVAELKAVNSDLWEIEDFKRACEREQMFDHVFVQAARQVYLKNDERARIKRDINIMCGSTIVEEKSYA
jgi:hypothetical protein